MKLKVLPPTLRKNHHYLILDVKSEVEISKEDMLVYCWDACIRYWGENHSSNFDLWVMRHYLIEESTHNDEHHHYGSDRRHGNKRMPDDSEDAFLD